MWKKVLFGLAAPVLALAGFAAVTVGQGKPADLKVNCCGECKPGDDCLANCEVKGDVPKDMKLPCCGNCQKGEDCLATCGARKLCCEVN